MSEEAPSEMVERVARAMFAVVFNDLDFTQEWDSSEVSEGMRGYWRERARAAIAAMREPTAEMVEAAADTLFRENRGVEYAPAIGWRAMIDAALSPHSAAPQQEPKSE